MEKSTDIKELAIALCKFQEEMEPVIFDAANPFFKSKYATLAKLVSMAAPVHTKYGLSVSQLPEGEGSVTTILMHISGQWISSTLSLKALRKWSEKKDGTQVQEEFPNPQTFGAVITYSRRFAYASILGLISEEDDDGNKASHLDPKKGETIEPQIIRQQSLRDSVKMRGQAKFGDLDRFTAWRVDNNLVENLDKATDFELATVSAKLLAYKK